MELATDRCPPFTLKEVADTRRTWTSPTPTSCRGLVLVKWWLLASPQYLVMGVLAGGL